jgi:transposase
MARERIQTRADADTLEQVEQYAEDKDISYSEAVRRLVRTGLIEKGYREAEGDGDELAEARMNQTARQSGTILMILMLAFLTAAEVGLL